MAIGGGGDLISYKLSTSKHITHETDKNINCDVVIMRIFDTEPTFDFVFISADDILLIVCVKLKIDGFDVGPA